jgi:hypothetical protein
VNAQPIHLADYAAKRTRTKRRAASEAIRRLDERGNEITFAAIAREAGVDRSWLYSQTDLAQQITKLRQQTSSPLKARPRHERASTDSRGPDSPPPVKRSTACAPNSPSSAPTTKRCATRSHDYAAPTGNPVPSRRADQRNSSPLRA